MGRPKVPLIDRDEAIAKALEIIDLEGFEAFSIRRLGKALGVNGASLYHHFKDKDDILHSVCMLVLQETGVLLWASQTATWQDYVTKSVERYRSALLRHPNTAPLMSSATMRQIGHGQRDHLVGKMVETGVPLHLTYAIIDSVESLAVGSALSNPQQLHPSQRLGLATRTDVPHLLAAVRSGYRSADRLFQLELQALLAGWAFLIAQGQPEN